MLTGAILAGGQNKRMGGKIKALLPFLNERLIERQIREMQRICEEIIIVTNDPKPFLPIIKNTVRIITDFIPGKGPLSGMHAALSLAKHNELWIVGCNMPYISADAAELLFNYKQMVECDAVIPQIADQLYPLHSIYTKHSLKAVTGQLNKRQYNLLEFMQQLNHVVVDESEFVAEKIDLKFGMTMNTTAQYNQMLHLYSR